jgi:hypothetical protein
MGTKETIELIDISFLTQICQNWKILKIIYLTISFFMENPSSSRALHNLEIRKRAKMIY